MTVRQAGAPATDGELHLAFMHGRDKWVTEEYANLSARERLMCRLYPRLTFFFDGTGNNLYQELEKPAHEQALSNVAKLYRASIVDRIGLGATPTYIPGVGTPFRIPRRVRGYTDFLRDDPGGVAGLGLGAGGDMRIDYAISEFARILEQDWSDGALRHMKHLSLAVFGFSRGATQARAFVRRLIATRCQHTEDGLVWLSRNFVRVPLRITFLGLFDTVASVGGPTLHLAWASELAIPADVERCVHYVAAHEVRRAFPLDAVSVDGRYPANCEEVVYPGVHSDVGGGYTPDSQGRGNALARIPLRHMYAEALRAGVPLHLPDKLSKTLQLDYTLADDDPVAALYQGYSSALPAAGDDLASLLQAHRHLHFQWRGRLARHGDDTPVLGRLAGRVGATMCQDVPAATELDHPACPPTEWGYAVSPDLKEQARQLLGEQRRLARHVAFLRHPVAGQADPRAWPPPAPRPRTAYEDLILAAWDDPAAVPPPVAALLAEHVHDSVAHFTSWPCALYDPRGVYCDRTKRYAEIRQAGADGQAVA